MALKATIFKAELALADMDRGHYADYALTLARHPSETDERMMVRLLAFALNADPSLEFGKDLSADDGPDLCLKDLTGAIRLWIDVGLPDEKRVRRACGRADAVWVLSYGGRPAEAWWGQSRASLGRLDNLGVLSLPVEASEGLAGLAQRGMRLQCNIQENQVLLTDGERTVHIEPRLLQAPTRAPRP